MSVLLPPLIHLSFGLTLHSDLPLGNATASNQYQPAGRDARVNDAADQFTSRRLSTTLVIVATELYAVAATILN